MGYDLSRYEDSAPPASGDFPPAGRVREAGRPADRDALVAGSGEPEVEFRPQPVPEPGLEPLPESGDDEPGLTSVFRRFRRRGGRHRP